jgi:hypothetical protein
MRVGERPIPQLANRDENEPTCARHVVLLSGCTVLSWLYCRWRFQKCSKQSKRLKRRWLWSDGVIAGGVDKVGPGRCHSAGIRR